eukprot:6208618-Pleurochrysis_carterae.AAC.7
MSYSLLPGNRTLRNRIRGDERSHGVVSLQAPENAQAKPYSLGTVLIVGSSTSCATCGIYGISGGLGSIDQAVNEQATQSCTCVRRAQNWAARSVLAPGGRLAAPERAAPESRRTSFGGSRAVHHEVA